MPKRNKKPNFTILENEAIGKFRVKKNQFWARDPKDTKGIVNIPKATPEGRESRLSARNGRIIEFDTIEDCKRYIAKETEKFKIKQPYAWKVVENI